VTFDRVHTGSYGLISQLPISEFFDNSISAQEKNAQRSDPQHDADVDVWACLCEIRMQSKERPQWTIEVC
jgi:hypothetical protein